MTRTVCEGYACGCIYRRTGETEDDNTEGSTVGLSYTLPAVTLEGTPCSTKIQSELLAGRARVAPQEGRIVNSSGHQCIPKFLWEQKQRLRVLDVKRRRERRHVVGSGR